MIKRYDRFIESRKHRVLPEGVYTERHHILPRCQGGNNNNENLIVLTAREHYIAHKMLYRENKECNELVYAFHMMCSMKTNHQQRDYKITSRDFELSRIALSESMKGENNPNYGKHHPEETKEKMRGPRPCIQGENNPMYEVHRCGKDAPNYGKHHSEETRKKIGESSKDRHHSEETRKNLSEANKGENNPNYGKHHSEETKKKMGDKLKGRIP